MASRSEHIHPSNQPDFLKQAYNDLDPDRPSALGERRIVPDPYFNDPTDASLEHTLGAGGAASASVDKYFSKINTRDQYLQQWKDDTGNDFGTYGQNLLGTVFRRRNSGPKNISSMRDNFAALEPGKDYRSSAEYAQDVDADSQDGGNRRTLNRKSVTEEEINFLIHIVDDHIIEYSKGVLTENLRDIDKEGTDLKKLIADLKRDLGPTFSSRVDLLEHYKLAALIKQTWKVYRDVARYDVKRLPSAGDILHVDDTGNLTQAEAFLVRDVLGEHTVDGEERVIDIMARVQRQYNPAHYPTVDSYKDYGEREIYYNFDGSYAVQTESGEMVKTEMQLLAQWLVEAFQTVPPISTSEAVAYLNGRVEKDSDTERRIKYIYYWGPKNQVLFGSLYPLLFLGSGMPHNSVLTLPAELLNDGLRGNTVAKTYPETGVSMKRRDRGTWQDMFATYEEISKLDDAQIMKLAREADMTSFHYMMTKLGQMFAFVHWISEKTELKKGKMLSTRDIATLFLERGSPGRELIKNASDRDNYMYGWFDWTARREVSIMKRAEEVTESVGIELQDLMRSYFDAGRFFWFEVSPINITEINPALWKPEERLREVLFRLAETDQAVWDSIKDDDGYNPVRNWLCKKLGLKRNKYSKEEKIADLKATIPGKGEVGEGLFMVLKMYLGYGDANVTGEDRLFYKYGRFGHIFNEAITLEDGTKRQVTFEELLKFTGMKIVDGHLAMVGNREEIKTSDSDDVKAEKEAWKDYTYAIGKYMEYFSDREANKKVTLDARARMILGLDLHVADALRFLANTGESAIDPLPGQPLRGKVLPVVRDRSDLYRPLVDAAYIYIKYYDPDFYYGGDRLVDFQDEANQRGALSRTGRPTLNGNMIGDPNKIADDEYYWGEVRDRLGMQQRYLNICMAPLAIKPRTEDLESIGIREETIDGRPEILIRAADDDVEDDFLRSRGYTYRGWVRYDSWQPRNGMVRVDNVRYASGSYANLTKYPAEVTISTLSHFENPMELIYLSLGRQLEVAREATDLELARRGVAKNHPHYQEMFNELLPETFVHNLSAQFVLTPGDHSQIFNKLLQDEMFDRATFNEMVLLSGCYTKMGLHHGSSGPEAGQRAAFEASCAVLNIPDKDIEAEAKHSDDESAKGLLNVVSNVHRYLGAVLPTSELLVEPLKGQTGRNLQSGMLTGAGMGAIGAVAGTLGPLLVGGVINPLLGAGGLVAGVVYGAWMGRDRGSRPSLISGVEEDTLMGQYAKHILGVEKPELGLALNAQNMHEMLCGRGRWNCIVDPKDIPKAIVDRFIAYRGAYNKAHGLDGQAK